MPPTEVLPILVGGPFLLENIDNKRPLFFFKAMLSLDLTDLEAYFLLRVSIMCL